MYPSLLDLTTGIDIAWVAIGVLFRKKETHDRYITIHITISKLVSLVFSFVLSNITGDAWVNGILLLTGHKVNKK